MNSERAYSPLVDAFSNVNLPLVDFTNWNSDSTPEERHDIGLKLVNACHNVGFV